MLTFLLGLLSAFLIAVAFRHLATKPSFYFACFYFYFSVFSRCGYCRLAGIVLAAWVAVPFFALPFLILAAIFLPCHFHRCSPFYRCSASNITAKSTSYSPALFSVPVKIREHAYQSFVVVSWYGESMVVVWLQYVSGCGKSTIKVQWKYTGSKVEIR